VPSDIGTATSCSTATLFRGGGSDQAREKILPNAAAPGPSGRAVLTLPPLTCRVTLCCRIRPSFPPRRHPPGQPGSDKNH